MAFQKKSPAHAELEGPSQKLRRRGGDERGGLGLRLGLRGILAEVAREKEDEAADQEHAENHAQDGTHATNAFASITVAISHLFSP